MKLAGSNRSLFQLSQAARRKTRLSREERTQVREANDAEWAAMDQAQAAGFDAMLAPATVAREKFAALADEDQKSLDMLIERVGLKSVLGTLAQLAEGRAPSEFDLETTFSDHDDEQRWTANANALYEALGRIT